MATTYDGTPTLHEILVGATLVATGRLSDVVDRSADEDGRPILTYRATVSDVLAGESPGKEILVRMVGEQRAKASDDELLLVLTEDHGVGRRDQYVPYFIAPAVLDKGKVTIGDEKPMGLDKLRERLSEIASRRERSREELARNEEGEDIDADYPEVSELGIGRGDTVTDAQLAAPLAPDDEGGPQQRRED